MFPANAVRLKLATGDEVQAFVAPSSTQGRRKCLLLHGNPSTMHDWKKLIALLSGTVDVAAIDMPGFGQSPRLSSRPEAVNLDHLADCVIAVADALCWTEPFFIIGHSHGGGVAQIVAAKYPERISGIVLISSLGFRTHATYRALSLPFAETTLKVAGLILRLSAQRPIGRTIMRLVMKGIWSPDVVPDEQVESQLALLSSRTEILTSMVHVARGQPCQYLARSASRIDCPVLVIHGDLDALVPMQIAKEVCEGIAAAGGQAELEILQGAGHALPTCQAAELAQPITSFISHADIVQNRQ